MERGGEGGEGLVGRTAAAATPTPTSLSLGRASKKANRRALLGSIGAHAGERRMPLRVSAPVKSARVEFIPKPAWGQFGGWRTLEVELVAVLSVVEEEVEFPYC